MPDFLSAYFKAGGRMFVNDNLNSTVSYYKRPLKSWYSCWLHNLDGRHAMSLILTLYPDLIFFLGFTNPPPQQKYSTSNKGTQPHQDNVPSTPYAPGSWFREWEWEFLTLCPSSTSLRLTSSMRSLWFLCTIKVHSHMEYLYNITERNVFNRSYSLLCKQHHHSLIFKCMLHFAVLLFQQTLRYISCRPGGVASLSAV